jgi:hypothetical protein
MAKSIDDSQTTDKPESAADLIKPHSRGSLLGGDVKPQTSGNTAPPDEAMHQHAHRGFDPKHRTPSADYAPRKR